MAHVITRLCRDCVDTACASVCPVDCIVEHRARSGEPSLPNQLFIDPSECIDCRLCQPECPWEAIFADADVPEAFHDDIAENARSAAREQGYHVPVARLARRPAPEEVERNRLRWH
jgi:ferredoxin